MADEDAQVGRVGAKRCVLVVEDSDFNRIMLRKCLKDQFKVIEARDGLEGLEQLSRHYKELSLIMLDVYMPNCDGFEFLRRMRADARYDTLPVIVATASDSLNDEIACLELGANDFITKPYNFKIIVNRMNNIVHLRESAAILNQITWDDVTGLYSKEFFYRAVEDELDLYPDAECDLVCSAIDNYLSLTERYGEEKCNTMLHNLAATLTNLLPIVVSGGRIGTDVFAFLIEHRKSGLQTMLESVADRLALPNVSVKFGVVERVDHAMTVSKVCNLAMSALETVKGRHGVEVALFDDELHERQLMERTIRESMELALKGLQFSVFFQPKFDVKARRVGGAEALVRWFHPEIGFISPGVFIPIFERNGFVTQLDLFVWEEACKEIERCMQLGLPVVPISVNASRLDFDLPDLPGRIAAIAEKHNVDPSLLHIEITETAYSDNPEQVVGTLKELRALGFSMELDDFGAGYSSLISLNTLPIDVMKLDMSMIRKATELDDFRIVESSIKLAQTLGLKSVVEGVETAQEAQRVCAMGCDYIQGFYYSAPLNREDFEDYLRRS